MTDEVVWTPDEALLRSSNWARLFRETGVAGIEELNARASRDPEWFWNALIRFQQFPFLKSYEKVLDLSGGIEFPDWCVGATTNIAIACLDRHRGAGAATALGFESEDGAVETVSYGELLERTCRLASSLETLGLRPGDRVGLFMPLMTEAVVAFLALARLGCVVLPLFSGFGPAAVADRLNDAGAVALVTVDGAMRRGARVDMLAVAREAALAIPTLEHIVVRKRSGAKPGSGGGLERDWDELLAGGRPDFAPRELPAEAPLMIVYTSGTTGKPKGTVHTHCGFGVKTGMDLHLIFDVRGGDRLMWMSDMGWLVGPVQTVGALMAGATLVLAEGVPDYPEPDRMWRLAERHGVTILGLSPTAARLLIQAGAQAARARDLSCVRIVASTGEPWDEASWMWVFENVLGRRGPLLNYSGGTEMGGILASHLLAPLRPASLHGPLPGTGADIVDESGNSVAAGQVGELVMREPCIGTTRGLWRDREKYLDTYWRRIPGMWVHGDWASRDDKGVWRLHGRSDDTIKLAGKRTGPAEIEAAMMATGLCADVAAVGMPDATAGAALVCAVVPVAGKVADAAFEQALGQAIVQAIGPAYRPRRIVVLEALPKTRNLKTMRRVIRALLAGEPPGDLSSLMNPECLDAIRAAGGQE